MDPLYYMISVQLLHGKAYIFIQFSTESLRFLIFGQYIVVAHISLHDFYYKMCWINDKDFLSKLDPALLLRYLKRFTTVWLPN